MGGLRFGAKVHIAAEVWDGDGPPPEEGPSEGIVEEYREAGEDLAAVTREKKPV